MNYINQQRLAAGERAIGYNGDHPMTPAVTRATALFTELGTVVASLKEENTAQAAGLAGFRAGCDAVREAVNTVLVEMRMLNKIARGLDRTAFPTMREQFRMPESRSFANITARGRAFAEVATDNEAVFTDRGLPAGFVAAFADLVSAAETALETRNTGIARRSGGTAGTSAYGRRIVAILRELDGIVAVAKRNDEHALAAWKTARRIARRAPAETTPTPPPSGGEGSGSGDGSGSGSGTPSA